MASKKKVAKRRRVPYFGAMRTALKFATVVLNVAVVVDAVRLVLADPARKDAIVRLARKAESSLAS